MNAVRKAPLQLVIDLTPYEEHAQVISIGLLQHSRVLPLVWKVMPGQDKWDQGLWECVEELFKRLAPHIAETSARSWEIAPKASFALADSLSSIWSDELLMWGI